jgi:hypothetical protein
MHVTLSGMRVEVHLGEPFTRREAKNMLLHGLIELKSDAGLVSE